MTIDGRRNLKDILTIIATTLSIILNMGVILGGMRWIAEVNANLATITASVGELKHKIDTHDARLNAMDLRHAGEDALKSQTDGVLIR